MVDDSVDLLEMIQFILTHQGYTVYTLTNGYNIKKEIIEFQPGLVMLDIYLADEDGRNICLELKKDDATKHIPILVFSASPADLKDYETYCADGVIEKPFDLKNLLQKIKLIAEQHKSQEFL